MLAFPFLLCSQSFFPKNLSGCNHCHSTRVINVSFPPLGHGHSHLILVFANNDTDACQIYNVRASHKHGTLRVFINSIFFNSRIKTIHTTLAHVHRSHTWIHGKPWELKYRANPSRQGQSHNMGSHIGNKTALLLKYKHATLSQPNLSYSSRMCPTLVTY